MSSSVVTTYPTNSLTPRTSEGGSQLSDASRGFDTEGTEDTEDTEKAISNLKSEI